VALDAAEQRGVVVLKLFWQFIKQWILADEIAVLAEGGDPGWRDQHSNESPSRSQEESLLVRAT
jgi:hypothetical protein